MRNAALALVLGTVLWGFAGWSAHPRELWDVPTFWPAWGAAVLLAGIMGLFRKSSPLRDTAFLFLPIVGVLGVQTLVTGGGASLLPLGLIAVAVLAVPGLALAWLSHRLAATGR